METSSLFDDDLFGNAFAAAPARAAGPPVGPAAQRAAAPGAQVSSKPQVVAATDGSALGNPGPAGWAWVVEDDGTCTGGSWAAGGHKHNTNNWGELTALLELLRSVPNDVPLEVRMDSTYALKAASEWRHGWKRKGWKTSNGQPVKNLEIIQEIDRLLDARRAPIEFVWVKAHKTDGTGDPRNEAADRRANAAATSAQRGLDVDAGPGWSDR